MKNLRKKFLIAFLAIFLLTPGVSHAGYVDEKLAGAMLWVINGLAFRLSWLVGLIAGFFVALEAWAVQFILLLNFHIVDSEIVQFGFPVVLSIANLIFVLGLIVIAVATILQMQSYGMKQTLWKLLTIAIAVNFGLVIAGTILNFSDSITQFMVKSITPSGQPGELGLNDFASTLAGAFQPQRNFTQLTSAGISDTAEVSAFTGAFNIGSASSGALLKPILSVLLSIFSFLVILIAMGTLVVILIIRYVNLALLLVFLPIAWATWPFPHYSKNFGEWWSKFIKNAFSPIPIVFCLWLALILAQKMAENPTATVISNVPLDDLGNQNSIYGAVVGLLGGISSPLASNFLRVLLLGAIMMAGFAGSAALGAEFAKAGENAVKAVQNRMKKELTTRAGRTAKRAGLAVRERTQTLQRLGLQARQYTTAQIGRGATAASLALQNLALSTRNLRRQRTEVHMTGEILNRNNVPQGVARWDHNAHDWERDANKDLVAYDPVQAALNNWVVLNNGAGIQNSKVNVTGVDFVDHNGNQVGHVDRAQALNLGLAKEGKPLAEHAVVTTNAQTGAVTDARASVNSVVERLEHRIQNMTVQPGQLISREVRGIRQEAYGLAEEAAQSTGVGLAFTVVPLGDAAKALAKGVDMIGEEGGGKKHEEKKEDKKGGGAGHP